MERKIIADLHNHSTASDGEYTPSELVAKAKEIGLEAVALTDHDTLKGLNEAMLTGEKTGILVIPGVEVSLGFKRSYFTGTLHLLLYFMPEKLNDDNYVKELETILKNGRGEALVKARVELINNEFGPWGKNPVLNRNMKFDEIASYASNISRRHFAQALKEMHGINDKNKINFIIGNNSPAYIPSGIKSDLIRPFIERYSPLAVLAHPAAGSFPGPGHYSEVLPPVDIIEKIYPEFLDLGIKGIEVFYPAHTPEYIKLILHWANRDGLLITGGSDCHDKNERPLGTAGITREEFNRFYAALAGLGTRTK